MLEKFIKKQSPGWPALTIRKNGSLCINHRAIEQFKLEGMRFVSLCHDQKDRLLGIKPEGDESDPSVFRISREKARTFTISCQAFLKHFEIPYRESSRVVKATWDGKAEMILIKL